MAANDPFTAALNLGHSLLERVWPDKEKQAEAARKLLELEQKGDLAELQAYVKLMTNQAEINLQDAKSGRFFQSGWRPAIGWVGAISLLLMYIPKACMMTYIWSCQSLKILDGWDGVSDLVVPAFPDLGVSDVIGLLMSMLGVAAMRSFDKKNKTDTK